MGNVANVSDPIVRHYPQNPPACTQCPPNQPPTWLGGFIDTPTNETCVEYFGPEGCTPVVDGLNSPVFLVLYFVWSITIVTSIIWTLYRRRLGKYVNAEHLHASVWGTYDDEAQQAGIGFRDRADHSVESETSRDVPTTTTNNNKIVRVEYYKNTFIEKPAMFLLILNGLVLLAYWLVLTIDFYSECDFVPGAIESACFFGTFRIFGNYENNAESFFLIWGVFVVYCSTIALFLDKFHDWTRIECSSQEAEFARVYIKKEETEIVTDGEISCGARLVFKVEICAKAFHDCLFGQSEASLKNLRTVYVKIRTTPLGRRYFVHECVRYSVPGEKRVSMVLDDCSIGNLRRLYENRGLDSSARKDMLDRCGKNEIPLESPRLSRMILDEFVQPFYVYQLMIYLIWIWWTYWIVGVWLLSIVLIAACWSIYVKLTNLKSVHALADNTFKVSLLSRDQNLVQEDAVNLVCGDVIKVLPHSTIPADIVLIQGSCAMDESGLTGESIPKAKTPVSNAITDAHLVVVSSEPRFKPSVLFSGTNVVECSEDAFGVVISVGTDSTRGRMLSRVLFPSELKFQFDQEFPLAIFILFVYSIVAFAIALIFQSRNGANATWPTKLAYGIFTISQIVSPMLKIALVAGRVSAIKRLKTKNIVCLDAQRIDVAGKINAFCFDKTGTLTRDTIVFSGYIGLSSLSSSTEEQQVVENDDIIRKSSSSAAVSFDGLENENDDEAVNSSSKDSIQRMNGSLTRNPEALLVASTCHSISKFHGQLFGSPMEIALFQASGSSLTSATSIMISSAAEQRTEWKILRRLAFDPTRRMMSCVVENVSTGERFLTSKGALDSICSRANSSCDWQNSNIVSSEQNLSSKGMYVLGFALRHLNRENESMEWILNCDRDELECEMKVLGLSIFANELKSDARHAIEELHAGNVRTIMITGDNAPCAIHIAKECSILDGNLPILIAKLHQVQIHEQQKTTNEENKQMSGNHQLTVTWEDAGTHELVDPHSLAYGSTAQIVIWDGACFDHLLSTCELKRYLPRIKVFARMNPDQKAQCVRMIITLDQAVCGFVGDGSNDCGALRQASVGLSMSSSSDSVVASFACSHQGEKPVMLVLDLLCEGRCALATSLASYKLLVMYGLLFSIVKLASFYFAVLMPILGYIMIDVVALVPMSFLITLATPLKELREKRPTSSLFGLTTIGSIMSYLICYLCALSANLAIMQQSPEYVRWPSNAANAAAWWYLSDNFESSVLWVTCFLFFICSSMVFSHGGDFRMPRYVNWQLSLWVILMGVMVIVVFLFPVNPVSLAFHIASEPFNRNNSQNPIWQNYQKQGGLPSPGMSFDLRMNIFIVTLVFIVFADLVERCVILGRRNKTTSKNNL